MERQAYLELQGIAERTIKSAGPRYTPGNEADAPNLAISDLDDAINGLAFDGAFRTRANELSSSLDKAHYQLVSATKRKHSIGIRRPYFAIELLSLLGQSTPQNAGTLVTKLKRSLSKHSERVASLGRNLSNQVYQLRSEGNKTSDDPEIRSVESLSNYVQSYRRVVLDVEEFVESPACQVQLKNSLLLLGEWGTGKTHHLADSTRRFLDNKHPVLFVLAKDFSTKPSPFFGLTQHSGICNSFSKILIKLDRLGKAQCVRSLLIIDGINESNRDDWKAAMPKLVRMLSGKKNVGLVLSCRTPFDQDIFSTMDRRQFTSVFHHGFTDIEFDAQSEFFKYYSIPLPDVPLLAEEFSRPLTLKVLCQAFRKLPRKLQKKGFCEMTSGQRGMTFILETFIKSLGVKIEEELKLSKGYCWKLIKGRDEICDDEKSGLASWMATHMQDSIPFDECIRIILADPLIKSEEIAKSLYYKMIAEGLLIEDHKWTAMGSKDFTIEIRLPYERFSDHIVARDLLDRYLDTGSEAKIRRSFYKDKPLGKIFEVRTGGMERFFMPGWAEAIIIEFPERVKKSLPENQRELFFLSAQEESESAGLFRPVPRRNVLEIPNKHY